MGQRDKKMNLIKYVPNFLTLLRMILVIPIVILLFEGYVAKLISGILFIIAGFTDYIDGKVARKYKAYSEFGNFMDPLADKLLIISILIAFLKLDPTIFPYWMVWLIISREFIITALRIGAVNQNSAVKTLYIGKLKTTAQFLTIATIIILLVLKDYLVFKGAIAPVSGVIGMPFDQIWFNYFGDWAYFITYTPSFLLGISTFLSLYSGIYYVFKNKKVIFQTNEKDDE
jgi:CDP-diacylglycerol--glycerol-3-phosphate 3-phosphatidyltransferase